MISRGRQLAWTFCEWLLVGLMLASGTVKAQGRAAPSYKPEEIEALVAPIALYPDSVLSQVLMASTYPLEIVYAARWVKAHPNLKGDDAVQAVANESWDVSVKSLVAFPQILEPMHDKLDWTQRLGDAVLAQEKDVLAAVQRLRSRAQQAGNLQSNEQQRVIVEQATTTEAVSPTIVRIEPANPQVIYVPAYDPAIVYGGWGYPAYPPYYWPPYPAYYPGGAFFSGFAWGVGFAAAGAIFGNCNWGGGDINIDINRGAHIDHHFDRSKAQGGRWQHDASHRQGVAYRDNASREKFGRNVSGADRRADFRGRERSTGGRTSVAGRAGAGNRAAVGDRAATGGRAGASNRLSTSGRAGASNRLGTSDRAGASNRLSTSDRARAADRYSAGFGGRDNSFQGVGSTNVGQRDVSRGQSSMQSSGFNRPSGGGGAGGYGGAGRGGGGGFGGGGRGGGGRR
ncbi:DUF3300 domain-containing protein [Cupriavidus lacunae]|uniref:DUF3300 domain-containing protein n=1 Tax=Cupriavidus lacunae TaxID=2666307 RepID=A0A370NQ22_9BURK|nr:DUF3300 domain-containing protein [Cupriavidus lacunae]RDK07671.1 DUF3300 domain-containing protein [Cupriavidus lacunae]